MEDQELSLEADLLHPLATLHWERCPRWDKIITWNCAVLHDIVCVVSPLYANHDMLTVFSTTDLHSQTTPTLPCENMALTTYQSKFVAVGGRHRGTHEVTNKLWTSDTGENWQLSPSLLPPMPTKRHSTTALSIGSSPQYLVVAGGRDSETMPLNVVEVLVGEQWTTVDPLPEKCYAIHSTLHDENLYFMGGCGLDNSIFTCKCNSLILSCGYANNNSSTSGTIWSEFKAPYTTTAIVSYGQRLFSIGKHSTIRAYSSMSQSWMEPTRDGYDIEGIGSTIAVVHLTKELIVGCEDCRAYRVTLSVSTFDPDSKFISGVLLRLEAVMGIRIVSALAKVYSKVTTRSGLQPEGVRDDDGYEIELANPQDKPSKYVMEVMYWWSTGHSYRPCTWRELLDVLREVGLQELSQQIEAYMKGLYPLNPPVNPITPISMQVGDTSVTVLGLEGPYNSPNGSDGGPSGSPPSSSGPFPLKPTTHTSITVQVQVNLSEEASKPDIVLVAKNSIGSESSKPRTFRDIPKTSVPLTLGTITLCELTDENGQPKSFRILDEISSRWTEAGDLLGLSPARLDSIKADHSLSKSCCREVLHDWIQDNQGSYPVSWEGLIRLLKNMKLTVFANELENALRTQL